MAHDIDFEAFCAARVVQIDGAAEDARAREAVERANAWANCKDGRTYDQMFPPTRKED